jgi:hypothetical protein
MILIYFIGYNFKKEHFKPTLKKEGLKNNLKFPSFSNGNSWGFPSKFNQYRSEVW